MTSESADRGILVTVGSFTREAKSFAHGKPIALVEGPELWELVQSVKATNAPSAPKGSPIPAQPNPSIQVTSPGLTGEATPNCPKCGALMVFREAKKGPNAGSRFWGCSRFPQCRGTRQ